MAQYMIRQSSFAGGEIAPNLYGHATLSKYLIGAKRMLNMIPLAHGPAINRPGTEYVAWSRPVYALAALHPGDSEYPGRTNIFSRPFLLEFEYSSTDTYCLEVGRGYIRFTRDGAPVLEGTALTIHDITEPGTYADRTLVEMSSAHGYQHGDMIFIEDCTGETAPNNRFWYVRRLEGLEVAVSTVTENVVLQGAAQGVTSVTDTGGVARVVTAAPHGYSDGWKVWLDSVSGDMGTAVNNKVWVISYVDASTFDLVDSNVAGLAPGAGGTVDRVTSNLARVVTSSAHNLAAGDQVYIDLVSAEMADHVNDQYWSITVIDATTFDLTGSDPIRAAQGTGGWSDAVARSTQGAGGPIADDEFYLMDARMDDVDMGASGLGWGTYTQDTGTAQRRYELRADRMTDKADVPYQDFPTTRLNRAQSADVMPLCAQTRDFAVRKLVRSDHDDWDISEVTWQPEISTPGNLTVNSGSGTDVTWYVTAVSDETGEESSPATVQSADPDPSGGPGTAVELEWDEVTGAKYYLVYRTDQSYRRAGFCGLVDNEVGAGAGGFNFATAAGADAIDPDFTLGPPNERDPFGADGSDDCPGVLVWHEQRLFIGSTNNAVQQIWASVAGVYFNLNDSVPLAAEDALSFVVASEKENRINNLISLGDLVVSTSSREFRVSGASGNTIAATAGGLSALPQTHYGSGVLQAIPVDEGAVFITDVGPTIRDLAYSIQEGSYEGGYTGSDLSILARHLLDGYEMLDWCYAKAPWSLFWIPRDDGTMLSLTYKKEHDVFALAQHSTAGGEINSVCAVREGSQHRTYLQVTRTIDGNVVECIERMHHRDFRNYDKEWDVRNAVFLDCSVTYDDPHPTYPGEDPTNNYVDPATGRFYLDNASTYFSADSGSWPDSPNEDGDWVDLAEFIGEEDAEGVDEVADALNDKKFYVVNVTATYLELSDVEDFENVTDLDSTYMDGWTVTRFGTIRKRISTITNLHQYEGEELSILANGHVAEAQTVTDGQLTLGADLVDASRIHLGFPIIAQLELLDAETSDPNNPIAYFPQTLESCAVLALYSRGIQWGPDEENLTERIIRQTEQYGKFLPLESGILKNQKLSTDGNFDHSRLLIQQSYPLPLEIQAVIREIDVKHG